MNDSLPQLVKEDSYLEPFTKVIRYRMERYHHAIDLINKDKGGLTNFSNLHESWGLNFKDNQWHFREWLPGAYQVALIGDFNDWNPTSHILKNNDDGTWQISLPANAIQPGQKYKIKVHGENCSLLDRVPALAKKTYQDPESHDFTAVVPSTTSPYVWKSKVRPKLDSAPLIYEAHIGIAGEEPKIHSYRHFAEEVIPRIAASGYNTIQLMAVAEHPYYGSFGYHVSSFFAPSSRFGTPDDLKYLIDTAHSAGLVVLMDVVHSHAVKNIAEGLNDMDGSGGLYFHSDERGNHPDWDSKCFDYGREEVQRFLLSNLRYWMEEFHFDGFRFDGVTSMLYWNRGKESFDHYDKYFGVGVDGDAILYLQLATTLVKQINPHAVIIAEDMSGMPGLCRPIHEGGIGFTHRLAMGIPDYWIKTLKENRDEDWDFHELWHTLTNRRTGEKYISYTESHDQALVGDKSLAFLLMDKEMYDHMSKDSENLIIERGVALHKMIRLLTLSSAGEGYLTFMGNEFGHPEWLDFPREGNEWSYHYARRQWSLVENSNLRYTDLHNFEVMMLSLDAHYPFLHAPAECVRLDPEAKILALVRGDLLFVFNFSVGRSYEGSEIWLLEHAEYKIVLDTDSVEFGGYERIDHSLTYETSGKTPILKLYLPARTGLVLKKI